MAIQTGYQLLKDVLLNTIVFDVTWLASIILTGLTLLILTRDWQKWKTLAFPVMMGWHIAGVPPFIIAYIASGIVFAIESFSLQTITGLLSTIKIPEAFTTEGLKQARKRKTEKEIAKKVLKSRIKGLLTQKKQKGISKKNEPIFGEPIFSNEAIEQITRQGLPPNHKPTSHETTRKERRKKRKQE